MLINSYTCSYWKSNKDRGTPRYWLKALRCVSNLKGTILRQSTGRTYTHIHTNPKFAILCMCHHVNISMHSFIYSRSSGALTPLLSVGPIRSWLCQPPGLNCSWKVLCAECVREEVVTSLHVQDNSKHSVCCKQQFSSPITFMLPWTQSGEDGK